MNMPANQKLTGSRHNLFGFKPTSAALARSAPDTTRQRLAALGLSVRQREPGHWLVTRCTALPELHFYSELELAQFATDKASHYACRSTPEKK